MIKMLKKSTTLHIPKTPIAAFLICILIVYAMKPFFLFQENGRRRQFGIGYNHERERKTLFDMTFMVVIISLVLATVG
jgi:hypothetical protein